MSLMWGIRIELLTVESYSGRKADERPVRFRLGEGQFEVEAVLDQWYDPESVFYKVRADDGNLFGLPDKSRPSGKRANLDIRESPAREGGASE